MLPCLGSLSLHWPRLGGRGILGLDCARFTGAGYGHGLAASSAMNPSGGGWGQVLNCSIPGTPMLQFKT